MQRLTIALPMLLAAVFVVAILGLEAIVTYNRRRQSHEKGKSGDKLGDGA